MDTHVVMPLDSSSKIYYKYCNYIVDRRAEMERVPTSGNDPIPNVSASANSGCMKSYLARARTGQEIVLCGFSGLA